MIPIFIEAALRSLLVGLAVATSLRLFRVSNVLAQKAAWGLVLVSAIAMPVLLPVTAQWHLLPAGVKVVLPAHPMTLLEELQARIMAKSGAGSKLAPSFDPNPQSDVQKPQETAEEPGTPRAGQTSSRSPHARHAAEAQQDPVVIRGGSESLPEAATVSGASPMHEAQSWAPIRHVNVSPGIVALALYACIAAVLVFRIGLGLLTTVRLWRTAVPVPAQQLPYDAASLPIRSSNIVASPLTIGSAILLPLEFTTWDREKLRIVLAHERSHIRQGDFYLQLLASLYTALFWFSPLGWWLKHELAELGEAISDRAGMEEAKNRTTYAQILLEFAAAQRRVSVGVAMARPGRLSRRIERLLDDHSFRRCFAGGRRALIAVAVVPMALFASTTLIHVEAAAGTQTAASAASKTPAAHASPPAPQPEEAQDFTASEDIQPGDSSIQQPEEMNPPVLALSHEPATPNADRALDMDLAISVAPVIRISPVVTVVAAVTQEGEPLSFDRTLPVGSSAQLTIATGSGDIQLSRSSGNQIHIHGKIHVSRGGSDELARKIAAEPPIEQSGQSVHVGQHEDQWHGISIDYKIEAPAGTLLTADSGSGNIVDEGVGQNAKLQTGSGDIHATGLEGPFAVRTGSGNIIAEQSGHGDVIAETGSGDIELKNINGSFKGETGSGDIKASGTPSASWTLQTGSGNVELWTGNAPLSLDASTGSGSVTTDHEMLTQGSFDHHHIRGTLNGGGPTVRVQTSSGDIRLH